MELEPVRYEYRMFFKDGRIVSHSVPLDENISYSAELPDDASTDWTRLGFHQCPHCPFSTAQLKHCPVARNIYPLVNELKSAVSHDQVLVEVLSPHRNYTAQTSLQRALSSLLGLVIGSSQCPHTFFFRPMAYFHLPFSNQDETYFRALSAYFMLRQIQPETQRNDVLTMQELEEIYSNLHIVNQHIVRRVRSCIDEDASINAVVLLDIFTMTVPLEFEADQALYKLYAGYLAVQQ